MIKNGLGTNAGGAKVVAPFLFYGLDWSLNKWKKSLEKNSVAKVSQGEEDVPFRHWVKEWLGNWHYSSQKQT